MLNVHKNIVGKMMGTRILLVSVVVIALLVAWAVDRVLTGQHYEEQSRGFVERSNDVAELLARIYSQEELLAQRWAAHAEVVQYATKLRQLEKNPLALKSSPYQEALRTQFDIRENYIYNYQIFSPTLISLSSNDLTLTGNTVKTRYPRELLEDVLRGKPRITSPVLSENIVSIGEQGMYDYGYSVYAGSPIVDKQGNVIAGLLFEFDPARLINKAFSSVVLHWQGEMVIFDWHGEIITHQHRQTAPVANKDSSHLLTSSEADVRFDRFIEQIRLSRDGDDAQQLTLVSEKPYLNHMGEWVMGVWAWLPQFGMGLALEIDREQYFKDLQLMRWIVWGGACFFCVAMLISGLVSRYFFEHDRKVQRRFSEVIEKAYNGFVTINSRSEIIYFNEAAEKMFGYQRDEVLGKPVSMLIPKRYHRNHANILTNVFSNGQAVLNKIISREIMGLTKDGREILLEIALSENKQGKNTEDALYTAIVNDVSPRVEYERKLLESECEMRLVTDAMPVGIAFVSAEFKIAFVNRYMTSWLGMERDELVNTDVRETLPVYVLDKLAAYFQVVQNGKSIVKEIEVDFNYYSQTLLVQLKPNSEQGLQKGFFIFISDITQQKNSERIIREERDRAQNYLDNAEAIIIAFDVEGRISLVNRKACQVLGFGELDLLGMIWYQVLSLDENDAVYKRSRFYELLDYSDGEEHKQGELEVKTKSGEVAVINWRSSIMYDGNQQVQGLLLSAEDVTELREKDKLNRDLHKQLVQAQKMEALGHLTGGIAHDFNNILASINGYAELLRHQPDVKQSDKLSQYVDIIATSGERATNLVKQMLVFSRGRQGEKEPLHLNKLLGDVKVMLRPVIPSSIELQCVTEQDFIVLADSVQIQQVIANLFINAKDAIAAGSECGQISYGVAMVDDIELNCSSCMKPMKDDYLAIWVEDSGEGIEPENINKIFQPFFTTKEVGKGTGMGLSVVHGIVHEHGGHIHIQSQKGQGTRFTVYLPYNSQLALQESEDNRNMQEFSAILADKKILYVDDEVSVGNFIKDYFNTFNIDVTYMQNSVEALDYFKQHQEEFDAIITDQTMPMLTGIEMAKSIIGIKPDMPIILCTGYSDVVDDQTVLDVGVRHFLQKPFDVEMLIETVKDMLVA